MPIKLLLAKPATNGVVKEAAQLHFEIWSDEEPQAVHKLKLYRQHDGSWKPELSLDISFCYNGSVTDCLSAVSRLTKLLSQNITKEATAISNLAKWL